MFDRYGAGLLAVFTLLWAAPAVAQDVPARQILADPSFLPLKGQVFGETDFLFSAQTGGSFGPAGARTSSITIDSEAVGQIFRYGLTDRLSLNLAAEYAWSRAKSTTISGDVTHSDVNGFEDPSVGLTYRLIRQADHPVSVDLTATYAPDLISADNADAYGGAGSRAFGGSQAQVSLAVAHGEAAFTVQGTASIRYVGDRTVEDLANGDEVRTASYWVPAISVASRIRLSDRLSANLGAQYDFEGEPAAYNQQNGLTFDTNIGNVASVAAALNYLFISARFDGSLIYRHTFDSSVDATYPANPAFNSSYDREGNSIELTLRYTLK
jgi:hypothetical protein